MGLDRFNKVGIQRELRMEWLDQAVRIHAVGYKKSMARQEIYEYLDTAPGFDVPPSSQTKTYIANALIKTWISPDVELISLRDTAFSLIQNHGSLRFPIHWCLMGAAYPFWFAVAAVVGRLLNLQEQVSQAQIVSRLKEKWGDRQTVSRRARYVIRSFVAWGALKDATIKGCYEKKAPILIDDADLAVLMLKSALHAIPEGKGALGIMLNNPAFFPFHFPVITGDFISQRCNQIEVVRYGLDDELLKLKITKDG